MIRQTLLAVLVVGLVVVLVSAQSYCPVTINQESAIEQYTSTVKTPVYESKQVTVKVPDLETYQSEVRAYFIQKQLYDDNQLLEVPEIMDVPVYPKIGTKDVVNTVKVPKMLTRTIYYLNLSNFPDIIQTKQIKIQEYTIKNVTMARLRKNVLFNQETGEFYKLEKC